jgi:hypothetical protein
VPILLQKSAIGAVWRVIDWFLGCRLPIAPFGATALTFWRRHPHRLRRARGDCWWWSDDQLGEPAQVLRDGCKGELVLCTARASQPKATKLQDALQVCKQHLDTLPIAA